MKNKNLWGDSVGLALLYTSAFYLPQVGNYFFADVGPQILFPTAIGVSILTFAAYLFQSFYFKRRLPVTICVFVIASLSWIAFLGIFSAAGHSALTVALGAFAPNTSVEESRWVRIALVSVGVPTCFIVIWTLRGIWPRILRLLSILGYSFALLAMIRVGIYQHAAIVGPKHQSVLATGVAPGEVGAVRNPEGASTRRRQVVWVIMDELDYDQTLGTPGGPRNPSMPNLERLASAGVSASNAYSPAKDTVASIPALLTGYDLVGLDFENVALWLKTRSAGIRRFQESDSVFAHIPEGPQSAAILGYYHPYCTLFPSLGTCVASPVANVGRWFDAITFFSQPVIAAARWLPASSEYLSGNLFSLFEPMYRITETTLREYPHFVALDDKSLVFIHVDLPHAPGDYSQRVLRLKTAGNDHESYLQNLQLVDQLIGTTMSTLKDRSDRQDILLILSSDHWHRIDSPLTPQRIPWIAWHVGDTAGIQMNSRINTVHTEELVLEYLQGRIQTQEQIAAWWQHQSFPPTLMPHGNDY
jgi:hypothetical protein